MRSRLTIPAIALCAAASGACTPTQAPIVDMTGKDQATYNRDLAACYEAAPAVAFGNPITDCMKAKGYTILVGY